MNSSIEYPRFRISEMIARKRPGKTSGYHKAVQLHFIFRVLCFVVGETPPVYSQGLYGVHDK